MERELLGLPLQSGLAADTVILLLSLLRNSLPIVDLPAIPVSLDFSTQRVGK